LLTEPMKSSNQSELSS
jgi:hypothetical protein